ncbi:hypothetical protein Hbor_18450 [Halogeometricum borinquense DSM 11551]|uniref:Uncharacterized protein n=1 Tax=Halogeometricum borinquense (strain ATCC 700274 / DSM 11551 / JCM 10706 / KCTC 4070 / PR3) TaxID=469382 RepID=E4NN00_HALBP|nr:hypothetical protein Hbor_18450 [Halogeometricum borinquense DSM 11551]
MTTRCEYCAEQPRVSDAAVRRIRRPPSNPIPVLYIERAEHV